MKKDGVGSGGSSKGGVFAAIRAAKKKRKAAEEKDGSAGKAKAKTGFTDHQAALFAAIAKRREKMKLESPM